jgi:drug/metabolite transporter (DMT)-like permease
MRFKPSRLDALLVLMTVIWGVNYSIVKMALRAIPPLAFNSLRLLLASLLFLLTLALCPRAAPDSRGTDSAPDGCGTDRPPDSRGTGLQSCAPAVFQRSRIPGRDWLAIASYGLIGHFVYQLCFVLGIARTTAANSSLILGCSPVAVALLAAAIGQERVRRTHWAGAMLSVAGIYLVVGRGASLGGASLAGDALTLGGVVCWAIYTVGSKRLLERYSPLEVTGYSMAIGTVPFVLAGSGELAGLEWTRVPGEAWAALIFSAIFALFVGYFIWYAAVHRIGNVRTSMYSNVTPVAALVVAVVWLGERLTGPQIAGAVAVVAGMALTRLVTPAGAPATAPAEE